MLYQIVIDTHMVRYLALIGRDLNSRSKFHNC